MPDLWTNPEPGLDVIATEDLDPKIRAGLEKIRRYDEMLLAKEAEQRMVEQETLERAGGGGGDGADSGDVRRRGRRNRRNRRRRRKRRRRRRRARRRLGGSRRPPTRSKASKDRPASRTLRGDDAERMGGAAARNAANTASWARRLAKLTEEEDALAEQLLEAFARDDEEGRSGFARSTRPLLHTWMPTWMPTWMLTWMPTPRSAAASTRSFASSAHNPFAVPRRSPASSTRAPAPPSGRSTRTNPARWTRTRGAWRRLNAR